VNEKTDETGPAKKSGASPAKGKDWGKGQVSAAELLQGTEDSDSVRRLQHALGNVENLPSDLKPKVNGHYDAATARAVRWWQNNHGYVGGRGINPNQEQAAKILGDDYTVVDE
jgi:hypothetical protein